MRMQITLNIPSRDRRWIDDAGDYYTTEELLDKVKRKYPKDIDAHMIAAKKKLRHEFRYVGDITKTFDVPDTVNHRWAPNSLKSSPTHLWYENPYGVEKRKHPRTHEGITLLLSDIEDLCNTEISSR